MDAHTETSTSGLSERLINDYKDAANEVCGGFYVDNIDTGTISRQNIDDFYINTQVL